MFAPLRRLLARDGSGVLARRIGRSFARVIVVATVVCGLLLLFLADFAGTVMKMQRDEHAIQHSLDLATAIREQYIHAAHVMIQGDRSHLAHYRQWVARVKRGADALRQFVPAEERWRVDRIRTMSRAADEIFESEVLPAVSKGDTNSARAAHRKMDREINVAAEHADHLARSAESRMVGFHTDATRETYLAAVIAVLGILGLIGLAAFSTRRLRDAVLRPLGALGEAARRIGRGDFQTRVELKAEGELGLVGSAFDRMAEELSEHQRRLIANERMAAIGQLAAGVAHEINNPIGVIRGYLRMMIPEAQGDELKEELLILDEEAAACQRIADDLVAYARSPDLVRRNVDLGDLLRQTGERFQASGESKDRRVSVDAQDDEIPIDRQRMRQVLQNLLRNATQASPEGGRVELRGEVLADCYVIRVLDRGPGIPPELRLRIFEPFVSGRAGGSGLGLAVCDGIVRAHGGSIEAREREGGGTQFVVSLPRHPAASSDSEPPNVSRSTSWSSFMEPTNGTSR